MWISQIDAKPRHLWGINMARADNLGDQNQTQYRIHPNCRFTLHPKHRGSGEPQKVCDFASPRCFETTNSTSVALASQAQFAARGGEFPCSMVASGSKEITDL